jgi:hypothetical protein
MQCPFPNARLYSGGEPHVVVTQNALADGRYVEYMSTLYGDRLATLTEEDSQRAFQDNVSHSRVTATIAWLTMRWSEPSQPDQFDVCVSSPAGARYNQRPRPAFVRVKSSCLALVNDYLAAIRIEHDSEAAHGCLGDFSSKRRPVLEQPRHRIQFRNFKGEHRASHRHGMIGIRRADSKRRVTHVILEPLSTGLMRKLQAQNVLVEVEIAPLAGGFWGNGKVVVKIKNDEQLVGQSLVNRPIESGEKLLSQLALGSKVRIAAGHGRCQTGLPSENVLGCRVLTAPAERVDSVWNEANQRSEDRGRSQAHLDSNDLHCVCLEVCDKVEGEMAKIQRMQRMGPRQEVPQKKPLEDGFTQGTIPR